MPLWAEKRISEILNRYADSPTGNETIAQVRKDLAEVGLGEALGDFLV